MSGYVCPECKSINGEEHYEAGTPKKYAWVCYTCGVVTELKHHE